MEADNRQSLLETPTGVAP